MRAAIEKVLGFRYIAKRREEMPIFEYKCQDCGTKFEKIVSSSASEVVCKACDSPRVEKLLSVFAVVEPSRSTAPAADDPCATCGARERGMCGL
jgi:putative FmdB family regulatory protein